MASTTGDEPLLGRRLFPSRGGEFAERVVAVVRLIFAGFSLVAIYLDPTAPARYVTLAYGLLDGYAVYSLFLLVVLRFTAPPARPVVIAIHVGDVVAATVLTLFTEEPSSPFFVLFGFTLLAAGYRWGLWETLSTGIVSGLLLGVEAVLTSSWIGQGGVVEGEFELNRFILRCTYLVLLAVMVGYIAEQEKLARADATARGSTEERARMARELHDGVIQSLIGLKMQVELRRASLAGSPSSAAALEEIETSLGREIVNLRTFMFETTSIDQEPGELPTILAALTERFGHASGISARFVSTFADHRLSPHRRREIGRIVQEALVNVRKHSGARHVLVSLSSDSKYCRLIVDDDGRGFDFEGRLAQDALDREHKGPRVIKERVRPLGGTLVVESRPDRGARLEISVPLGT